MVPRVCVGVLFLYCSGKGGWYQGSVLECCTCTTQVKEDGANGLNQGAVPVLLR